MLCVLSADGRGWAEEGNAWDAADPSGKGSSIHLKSGHGRLHDADSAPHQPGPVPPQVDRLRHNLMKAEDDCNLERKHTMKLKHAMEQRPSHEVVWEIQREKELLLAKNQELENTLQVSGRRGCEMGQVISGRGKRGCSL